MMLRVISHDHAAERRSRSFAAAWAVIALVACALWPWSVAWALLVVPLFALLASLLAGRRGVPRLEIHDDRLIVRQLLLDDVVLSRGDIAVFAVLPMKNGEAVVAFAHPLPIAVRFPLPRASDTVLPTGLDLPPAALQDLLAKWLAGDWS